MRKCDNTLLRRFALHQLIDSHAHLDDITDLDTAIVKAKAAGVADIIAVGIDAGSNQKVLQIAAHYPDFVYPALGYYPGNIKEAEIEDNLDFIKTNLNKAVAIGEVGLDYSKWVRAAAEKELQKKVFGEILKIAKDNGKPVLIHSRYAWRDALDMVIEIDLEKAVFHWYTGPSGVLRDIVARGCYISATPAVEYHEEHKNAVKETPLAQLLLETDSPVVYALGRVGEFISSPSDVKRSLKGAAALKGVSELEMAAVTTENARRIFGVER
jgi:TatD DNase family protein